MSAHTPGPWVLVHYAQGMDLPIPFMEHKTVAVFADGVKRGDVAYMQHGLYGDDQALANARLIAAAPELLEALRAITGALKYETYETHQGDALFEGFVLQSVDSWHKAFEAIFKATGEAA